jgi:hypothetical protein
VSENCLGPFGAIPVAVAARAAPALAALSLARNEVPARPPRATPSSNRLRRHTVHISTTQMSVSMKNLGADWTRPSQFPSQTSRDTSQKANRSLFRQPFTLPRPRPRSPRPLGSRSPECSSKTRSRPAHPRGRAPCPRPRARSAACGGSDTRAQRDGRRGLCAQTLRSLDLSWNSLEGSDGGAVPPHHHHHHHHQSSPQRSSFVRSCPVSTEGGTRRVRLVRKEGRGVSTEYGREEGEGGGGGAATCPAHQGVASSHLRTDVPALGGGARSALDTCQH